MWFRTSTDELIDLQEFCRVSKTSECISLLRPDGRRTVLPYPSEANIAEDFELMAHMLTTVEAKS